MSGSYGITWILYQYLTIVLMLFDQFNDINYCRC